MKTEQITEMFKIGCNLVEQLLLNSFLFPRGYFSSIKPESYFLQGFLGLTTCIMLHQFLSCKVSVEKTNNKKGRNKIVSRDHPQSLECLQLWQLKVCPFVCLKYCIDKELITDLADQQQYSQHQQTAGERVGPNVPIANPRVSSKYTY